MYIYIYIYIIYIYTYSDSHCKSEIATFKKMLFHVIYSTCYIKPFQASISTYVSSVLAIQTSQTLGTRRTL